MKDPCPVTLVPVLSWVLAAKGMPQKGTDKYLTGYNLDRDKYDCRYMHKTLSKVHLTTGKEGGVTAGGPLEFGMCVPT